MNDAGPLGCAFRDNISTLSFTSLGVHIDEAINQGGHEPYVFQIHGKLCHCADSL